METLRIADIQSKKAISAILMSKDVAYFKIGKTVDDLEDRRNGDEEYMKDYDEILPVYESEDKALIDELEKVLIRDYRKAYTRRCKNEQEGGGPNCADSDKQRPGITNL